MLREVVFLLYLCSSYFVFVASEDDNGQVFLIGLMPQPIYDKANVTWPVPPPSFSEGHSIKVAIKNYGDTSDDVGFHTFLPDYAEMTSFTMNTEGIAYRAKKTTYKEGQELMQVARKQNHNAALYVPQPLLDRYDSEIQTAKNTVHIKAGKEMTFDMQYKETLQDMIDSGVKVLNRARVAFDLFGATVEQMVGELYSPNYPNSYPNSADITWWVRVPEQNAVRLQIVDLDIEECCDRLTLYDGNSIHEKVIAVISGSMESIYNLTVFQSTTNSMFLHLTSDCSESRSGFKAISTVAVIGSTTKAPVTTIQTQTTIPNNVINSTVSANNTVCTGTDYLTAYSSYNTMTSINYPNGYYNNLYCTWRITSYYSYYVVKVVIDDIELESCCDYLRFHDGSSDNYPILNNSLTNGSTIYSTGRYMFVSFQTDNSVTRKGFQLLYKYDNPTWQTTATYPEYTTSEGTHTCNDDIDVDGYSYTDIFSPNYPGYYYNNLSCSWQIHTHSSSYFNVIQLDFIDLYLTYYDTVEIRDGWSNDDLIAVVTFSNYPSTIISGSNHLHIKFTSDEYNSARGFHIRLLAVPSQEVTTAESVTTNPPSIEACDGGETLVTYAGFGYIYSPYYSSNYANNMNCSWTIYSYYSWYSIKLQVYDLSLAEYDTVKVYDGSSDNNRLLGEFFDNSSYPVYSSGNYMHVKFESDSYYTARGFMLRYEAVDNSVVTTNSYTTTGPNEVTNCSIVHYINDVNMYGNLTSYNYPNNYPNNFAECWFFPSNYYGRLYLTFNDFQVESYYDSLNLYSSYGYMNSFSGSYYAGYSPYINSAYNYWLQFSTDYTGQRSGFHIEYYLNI